jgi:hypothetical protein
MSSHFISELDVELVDDDPQLWKLVTPLGYYSTLIGQLIKVPTGFTTDFASVPRIPLAYLLFSNIAHEPAVVHDFLYRDGKYSQEVCDNIFFEAMGVVGVPNWKRYTMYYAVRLFGAGFCKG